MKKKKKRKKRKAPKDFLSGLCESLFSVQMPTRVSHIYWKKQSCPVLCSGHCSAAQSRPSCQPWSHAHILHGPLTLVLLVPSSSFLPVKPPRAAPLSGSISSSGGPRLTCSQGSETLWQNALTWCPVYFMPRRAQLIQNPIAPREVSLSIDPGYW